MKKRIGVICLSVLVLAVSAVRPAAAQGHFEFGFHYGSWGLNLIKGVIDEAVSSALKSPMLDQVKEDYPDAVENYSTSSSNFDSGGSNFGFEVRWYPAGLEGSFSLGLAIEKTNMRVSLKDARSDFSVSFTDTEDGKYKTAAFSGAGSGEFQIHPLSFHFSLRWDIFPKAVVHPYITLGLGISPGSYLDKGVLSYDVHGTLTKPDGTAEQFPEAGESGSGTKTLQELRREAEDKGNGGDIPFWFVPFVQLHLGLKAKITPAIHVLVDAGVFDGFLLRAGVAVRL
jgi:hypothetical protein